ncbi:hypothetical protein CIHG_05559 [Coccidioides immitis H538.4]|uniref:Uncharacterized protein n=3 Tax=Coccidioides immitis TaxID=5501 RepID=A0A0J8R651_COCIT|nr:hypothetical protein CIRG_05792 [Coccidioides immitis RMSCC 2394]KMU79188.1 hypothetical protein CISG_07551 [Coccidioides immitis RMSCC 3703]KMU87790.1 hypothetical protein CIHG_05559 [Coccidioides immitis H538.4]
MNRPNCCSAHSQLDRPSTILRLGPTSARDSLSSRRPPMTRQISTHIRYGYREPLV